MIVDLQIFNILFAFSKTVIIPFVILILIYFIISKLFGLNKQTKGIIKKYVLTSTIAVMFIIFLMSINSGVYSPKLKHESYVPNGFEKNASKIEKIKIFDGATKEELRNMTTQQELEQDKRIDKFKESE